MSVTDTIKPDREKAGAMARGQSRPAEEEGAHERRTD